MTWARDDNVTAWQGEVPETDERRIPNEWVVGRAATGRARVIFRAKRVLWNLFKTAGLPVRYVLRRKLESFERRSRVDHDLANDWHARYLRGLTLPAQPVQYEYSYRKVEKLGFASLLGFRIIIQDTRRQPWWDRSSNAWFHLVPPQHLRVPLADAVVDLAFTDGAIFDLEEPALAGFFAECWRILKPGGYLVVWAGNSLSRSRSMSEIRWHGRIHSLATVRAAALEAKFSEVDLAFEGFSPPILPSAINTLRHGLSPWAFRTYDSHSWLARWQRPEKRAYWLLRLVKPAAS
ncbi:MAG: methyltransferase domain-containing protein [Acidobacteriota bacterium]|nr:methyltransferase domain-containing protein [Acidobacteriota bacterium]